MAGGWLAALLGLPFEPAEGQEVRAQGQTLVLRNGILRQQALLSADQEQTSGAFDFKWKKRDTFESPASRARMRDWLLARYGDVAQAAWWEDYGERPILLDAGCGASFSALELFGPRLARVRYLGVDVSDSVSVARERFREAGLPGEFLQATVLDLPAPDGSVDVVFSEGVLHHTESTRAAVLAVGRCLRPGGRALFYVYRRKGPIREFTDDYLRERLRGMSQQDAWDALMPLTRLGAELGRLGVTVNVPEAIELLGIPAGPVDLQRLFYWHVCKAWHHPDYSVEEMNHINFDWYAPAYAHRQTPEEVRAWCAEAGLAIEREVVEEAGITVVAAKRPLAGGR